MTVAIGLKFQEDIVLAADREESDSYLRDQVQKILRLNFPNKMTAGIAGAGDAHFIDYSAAEIKNYLWSHPRVSISQVGQRIETLLKVIFAQHVFATGGGILGPSGLSTPDCFRRPHVPSRIRIFRGEAIRSN